MSPPAASTSAPRQTYRSSYSRSPMKASRVCSYRPSSTKCCVQVTASSSCVIEPWYRSLWARSTRRRSWKRSQEVWHEESRLLLVVGEDDREPVVSSLRSSLAHIGI